MEKRVSKKLTEYQINFKNDIRDWINSHNGTFVTSDTNTDITGEFMRYLYDYSKLELSEADFKRRKRVTNTIPHTDRCTAKRANGDQCTRRRKEGCMYCGTHEKGAPHGVIEHNNLEDEFVKINIWVQEIRGIQYYLDDSGNVYDPKDILETKKSPSIIAKWEKETVINADGKESIVYHIPEFGI